MQPKEERIIQRGCNREKNKVKLSFQNHLIHDMARGFHLKHGISQD